MVAFQIITPQHHNSHSPQQYQSNWKQLTQLVLQLSHDEVSPYVLILTLLGSVWWGSVAFLWGFFFIHLPNLRFWPPAGFTGLQSVPVFLSSSFLSPVVEMKGLKEARVVKTPLTTELQVENLITIWEDKDHLKMLAWLAEIAISRRRIENRIFSEFMAAFVSACLAIRKGSGDRAAAAYGSFVRNWHRALYVSSHYKTTKQPTNNKQQTNQTIDNWQASLSTCRHVPSKDYVSLHKLHSPIDKTM